MKHYKWKKKMMMTMMTIDDDDHGYDGSGGCSQENDHEYT